MKKAVLTTAILTVLVSGSSMAATVYDSKGTTLKVGGRAEARFNLSDENESATKSNFKDKSRARVNLVGKTALSDDLYGFGKYEAELNNSDSKGDGDGDNLTNRYFYAGMGTSIGEFSYGKQDSAQVQVTNFTDLMNTFDEEAADLIGGNKDKRDNNFVYSGQFDALSIQANYIASDKKDNDSFGLSAVYGFTDSLTVGLGYVTQDNGSNSEDQFNIGGQFKLDTLTLGALYGTGTAVSSGKEVDADDYELGAKYKFGKTSLIAVYNFQEVDNKDTVDHLALEVEHKFNGHLRVYTGYKFEQLKNTDDQLQAGIRYDF
ncbi:porin [Vibrio gazogenes]|uniref:Outer membrane protein (Porin) n=1 Tax=Vibrio gazogenes DSM 21264 = NBRC 103151 TaxID=1123492 RepID=A0A1M4T905_VIBGA|nr:porin [Vibrio gazogenes]USP16042.1 porin [Vibrio gazogenes]SHE40854.1 Outer membrane protein (porin) [Vibrio gazogenes DSM 21264] [Vibrio gazogenes DSM 21264 = NBRC 103151]SJN54309.1 Porin-like protein L precursor [Vibrio gazogenes]